MAPQISVIIPVYNAEKTLKDCLDSVLGQSFRDMEIICVNDGSTDDSPRILSEYAAADGRVRAITKANGGAGSARNRGIDEAHGEYLAFIDADDFWKPKLLEKVLAAAEKHHADLCYYSCEQYDETTGKTSGFPHSAWYPKAEVFSGKDAAATIFQMTAPGPVFRIYRRDFLNQHELRFLDQHIAEDMYLTYLAAAFAERICHVDQVYAYFRRGTGDNLSSALWKYPEETHHCLLRIRERLEEADVLETFRKSFQTAAISNSEYTFWHIPEDILSMERRREMLAELGIADMEQILPYKAEDPQLGRISGRIQLWTHLADTLGSDYALRYIKWDLGQMGSRLKQRLFPAKF